MYRPWLSEGLNKREIQIPGDKISNRKNSNWTGVGRGTEAELSHNWPNHPEGSRGKQTWLWGKAEKWPGIRNRSIRQDKAQRKKKNSNQTGWDQEDKKGLLDFLLAWTTFKNLAVPNGRARNIQCFSQVQQVPFFTDHTLNQKFFSFLFEHCIDAFWGQMQAGLFMIYYREQVSVIRFWSQWYQLLCFYILYISIMSGFIKSVIKANKYFILPISYNLLAFIQFFLHFLTEVGFLI